MNILSQHLFVFSHYIGSVPVDINSGKELRTARRLSIITAPMSEQEDQVEESEEESEEESQEGEDEEEGMLDEAEYGYENMDESDEDDLDEESPSKNKRKGRILETGKASKYRRIRVGPQQNNDKSSNKKVPPQAHLSKVENMLHRASKNISVEHVHFPPPQLQTQLGKEVNAKGPAGDILVSLHYDYILCCGGNSVCIVFFFDQFSHVPLYVYLGILKQINKSRLTGKRKDCKRKKTL